MQASKAVVLLPPALMHNSGYIYATSGPAFKANREGIVFTATSCPDLAQHHVATQFFLLYLLFQLAKSCPAFVVPVEVFPHGQYSQNDQRIPEDEDLASRAAPQ